MGKKNKFKNSSKDNSYNFKNSSIGNSKYHISNSPIAYEELYPIFSFAKFKKNTKYYTEEHCNLEKDTLLKFLNAVNDISQYTWGEIKRSPRQFHAHEIDENLSNIPELNDFDDEIPFFQFKLPNHDKGRFVGFFDSDGIFNIILYDRTHKIYPRK